MLFCENKVAVMTFILLKKFQYIIFKLTANGTVFQKLMTSYEPVHAYGIQINFVFFNFNV